MSVTPQRRLGAPGRAVPVPTFSVVTAAYNEADDIEETLHALVSQTLSAQEIIVVDDGSTDETVGVVRRWTGDGRVTCVQHGKNRGCSAARNTGIRAATGDIVVFVDADVFPPPDFLECLARLYANADVDCVSVESTVAEERTVVSRYWRAYHDQTFGGNRKGNVGYTQGFSCRREAAVAVGFPEEIPFCSGEDSEFYRRLRRRGLRWKGEFSIVVRHRAPETFRGFWAQWVGRGKPEAYIEHRLEHRSFAIVVFRRLLSTVWTAALMAALVPHTATAARLTFRSTRGVGDLPAFWVLRHMQIAAQRVGDWKGLVRLRHDLRSGR